MIHFLNGDAFGGQLRDPKWQGLNPLFRAKLRLGDTSIHCYVKPIPDVVKESGGPAYKSAEILSEALGYTIAKNMGLPVAGTAGVILLDREQIPERVQRNLDAISDQGPQESYLSWFCQDMTHPNLVQKHVKGFPDFLRERRTRRLITSLAKNASVPAIISFDLWLQNSDRHLGNLLWGAGGNYTLIDHGRLFVWPDWTPPNLSHDRPCSNRLREIIEGVEPNWSQQLPNRGAMHLAYNTFAVAFREKGAKAASEMLLEFLEEAEAESVVDFITSRLDTKNYSKELGVLAI